LTDRAQVLVQRLKLKYEEPLSNVALNFNLRRYTEEAAAQAIDNYVRDGVLPEIDRTSSQFKGVTWNKARGKWRADCKSKFLGYHATEEDAAQAGACAFPLFSLT
jgi:hypothetical protein